MTEPRLKSRVFDFPVSPRPTNPSERDEQGRAKYLGYVLQFGEWVVYHSGDTVRYEGMAEKLRTFNLDVALLPINGRAPESRVPGNFSGPEAAQLAKDIGAKRSFRATSKCSNSTLPPRTNLWLSAVE